MVRTLAHPTPRVALELLLAAVTLVFVGLSGLLPNDTSQLPSDPHAQLVQGQHAHGEWGGVFADTRERPTESAHLRRHAPRLVGLAPAPRGATQLPPRRCKPPLQAPAPQSAPARPQLARAPPAR